jgi:hypothetical protein
VRTLTEKSFWIGVGTTLVALWLWRSYGSRVPKLPGANGG